MKILIVEDDSNKRSHLVRLVRETVPGVVIEERGSYQSGLAAALEDPFDLLILDMSMPTYDVRTGSGGTHRHFAGRDILRELQRKRRKTRAIIVTQFESFGSGGNRRTLDELKAELSALYADVYDSTVYYHAGQSDWREQLGRRIREIGGEAPRPEGGGP